MLQLTFLTTDCISEGLSSVSLCLPALCIPVAPLAFHILWSLGFLPLFLNNRDLHSSSSSASPSMLLSSNGGGLFFSCLLWGLTCVVSTTCIVMFQQPLSHFRSRSFCLLARYICIYHRNLSLIMWKINVPTSPWNFFCCCIDHWMVSPSNRSFKPGYFWDWLLLLHSFFSIVVSFTYKIFHKSLSFSPFPLHVNKGCPTFWLPGKKCLRPHVKYTNTNDS